MSKDVNKWRHGTRPATAREEAIIFYSTVVDDVCGGAVDILSNKDSKKRKRKNSSSGGNEGENESGRSIEALETLMTDLRKRWSDKLKESGVVTVSPESSVSPDSTTNMLQGLPRDSASGSVHAGNTGWGLGLGTTFGKPALRMTAPAAVSSLSSTQSLSKAEKIAQAAAAIVARPKLRLLPSSPPANVSSSAINVATNTNVNNTLAPSSSLSSFAHTADYEDEDPQRIPSVHPHILRYLTNSCSRIDTEISTDTQISEKSGATVNGGDSFEAAATAVALASASGTDIQASGIFPTGSKQKIGQLIRAGSGDDADDRPRRSRGRGRGRWHGDGCGCEYE